MSEESADASLSKIFGVLATISAGSILEMCGGASREEFVFRVAAISFSIALPISLFGFFMDEDAGHRKSATRREDEPLNDIIHRTLGFAALATTIGLTAIFAYFSPWAAGAFVSISLVGGIAHYNTMQETRRLQGIRLEELRIEEERLKQVLAEQEEELKGQRHQSPG